MADKAQFIPDKDGEAEEKKLRAEAERVEAERKKSEEIHTSDQFLSAIPNARWQATAATRLTAFAAALSSAEATKFAGGLTLGDQRNKFALIVRFTDTQSALALARANGWI